MGVPLVTLVEGSPPQAARDFSLAIQVRAPLGRGSLFLRVHVALVRNRMTCRPCAQAIGMNAAAIVAVCARIDVDWVATIWALLGAGVGVLLWGVLPTHFSSDSLSVIFAALWCGFAFCLGIAKRLGATASKANAEEVYAGGTASQTNVVMTLFGFGLLGGMVSMVTGLGVDTIVFAVLVLRFRVSEHVAQVRARCGVLLCEHVCVRVSVRGAVQLM